MMHKNTLNLMIYVDCTKGNDTNKVESKVMKQDVYESILAFIIYKTKDTQVREVSITYCGDEPFIHLYNIICFQRQVWDYCKQHHILLTAEILGNANSLQKCDFEELIQLNIRRFVIDLLG